MGKRIVFGMALGWSLSQNFVDYYMNVRADEADLIMSVLAVVLWFIISSEERSN